MVVLEILEGWCLRSGGAAETLTCMLTHTFTFTIYACSQESDGAIRRGSGWLSQLINIRVELGRY